MMSKNEPVGSVEETKAIVLVAMALLADFHESRSERVLNAVGTLLHQYLIALRTGVRGDIDSVREICDELDAHRNGLQ